MRRSRIAAENSRSDMSILTLDDDPLMTATLEAYFTNAGYTVQTENDPVRAIERIRSGGIDILLLDFLMSPICGDEVVRRIREFDRDLYIVLLTGHKSLAPPIRTIRELDIQGYYEKSDRFDQLELLVESCAKSIYQMRIIKSYQRDLDQLVKNTPRLFRLRSIEELMQEIISDLTELFNISNAYVCCTAEKTPYFLGMGQYATARTEAIAALEAAASGGGCGSGTLPLRDDNGRCFGLMQINYPGSNPEKLRVLCAMYANQAAAAFKNVFMHSVLRRQNEALNRSYYDMIKALRSMVDARDTSTRGHSDRVAYYAVEIARAMDKPDEYLRKLKIAGLFHDVGKLAVPDGILLKAEKLTDDEYDVIKLHPSRGKEILSYISQFSDITNVIASHHERIDGRGYPAHLICDKIPEQARIISIADAFDAMTSHRRYRDDLTIDKAIGELERGAGTQFDAAIVRLFIDILRKNPKLKEIAESAIKRPDFAEDIL